MSKQSQPSRKKRKKEENIAKNKKGKQKTGSKQLRSGFLTITIETPKAQAYITDTNDATNI